MGFLKTLALVAGLASLTHAHMVLNTPTPYLMTGGTLSNSPITSSNFPCKIGDGLTLDASSKATTMKLGSTQPLKFTGSAVHGGGSCQFSITYDEPANIRSSSTFKVITSIEGGCPATGQTGNFAADSASYADPDTYHFTIPDNIPIGNATLAWTWFNKVGNREMYMNCAPISLIGTPGEQSNYDALPDMFVANIDNGCKTVDSTDVLFPNPGENLQQLNGATDAFRAPTGNCQASSGGVATMTVTSAAAATLAASSPVISTSTVAASSSVPGDVFTAQSSSSSTGVVSSTVASPVASVLSMTTASAASAASNSANSLSSSSGGGSGVLDGACSIEGEWNCIGAVSYQRCASGQWSTVMPLAAGTSCRPGESNTIDIVAVTARKAKLARSARLGRRLPFRR